MFRFDLAAAAPEDGLGGQWGGGAASSLAAVQAPPLPGRLRLAAGTD